MDESASSALVDSEHLDMLAGEHRQLSERLACLDEVIRGLEAVVPLRRAEAALLEKFRDTRSGFEWKRGAIERELRKLDRHSGDDLMISVIARQIHPSSARVSSTPRMRSPSVAFAASTIHRGWPTEATAPQAQSQ